MTILAPHVQAFLDDLDTYPDRIPIEDLVEKLTALDLSVEDVAPFVKFGREHYRRNLVRAGSCYHALIPVLAERAAQPDS